ncbi:MAG: calcium-binding protein [Phycisphaerae bacterium]|nr:calcium-binding protein [Phycisphaerae bacterium]
MSKTGLNRAREQRITMEIVVDAYDESERAMGWYCYLENTLNFPFTARCCAKRAISPLKVGDDVEVIGMAPGEECEREMFVMIRWDRDRLAVPLAQLKAVKTDRETGTAIEDWHYWVARGYCF